MHEPKHGGFVHPGKFVQERWPFLATLCVVAGTVFAADPAPTPSAAELNVVPPTKVDAAASDAPATSQPLTWAACLAEAAAKNPDIAVAREAVRTAEAQRSGAYSGFFPQISATAGYTDSKGSSGSSFGSGAPTVSFQNNAGQGSVGQYSFGLTATQNIFNGFQDLAKVHQQSANLEAAQALLTLAKSTVSAALKSAFAQLLYQQDSIHLSRVILDRQKVNLRLVTLRFEGGKENRGNQLFQKATVAQADYQYQHSVRQTRVAVKQLGALIGRPEADELSVEGELRANDIEKIPDMKAIAARNPQHAQAVAQRAAADAAIDQSLGGYYPDVYLSGFVGQGGPNFPPATSRWSLGASISFPFFPGTSLIYGVAAARAQERGAAYNITSVDNKIIAQLENAFGNLKDAIGQVSYAAEFEAAAQARSKISREKYNTGLMTFEDWTLIETDLVNRQQTLLQFQLNAMQAEATWEKAQGIGEIP